MKHFLALCLSVLARAAQAKGAGRRRAAEPEPIPAPAPTPASGVIGAGVARADARGRAKHRSNRAIPSGERMTRQRLWAMARGAARRARITPAEQDRRRVALMKRGRGS